jgi:accessory gene regulator B
MIQTAVNRVISNFIKEGIVTEEDRELYEYGMYHGITMAAGWITAIIAGIAMRMARQSLLFLIFFIPVRKYAGGYHAKSQLGCYLCSTIMLVAILVALKFCPFYYGVFTVSLSFSAICLWLLSPMAAPLKPVSLEDKKNTEEKHCCIGAGVRTWFCACRHRVTLGCRVYFGKLTAHFNAVNYRAYVIKMCGNINFN